MKNDIQPTELTLGLFATLTIQAVAVSLIVLLSGCGKDDGGGQNPAVATDNSPKGSLALNELPDCSEANLDQLVYLRPEKALYACNGKEWETVELPDNEAADPLAGLRRPDPSKKGLEWVLLGQGTCQMSCDALNPATTEATSEEIISAIKGGLFKGQGSFRIWTRTDLTGGNDCRYMGTQSPNDFPIDGGQAFRICKAK